MWYEEERLESIDLSGGFSERLNIFEFLFILRCFRIDRIVVVLINFVMERMGKKFVMLFVLDYKIIYR